MHQADPDAVNTVVTIQRTWAQPVVGAHASSITGTRRFSDVKASPKANDQMPVFEIEESAARVGRDYLSGA
ncbi:protein of unknown function [Methylocella tundrae]|uniref:Uncharacterized protein n=1 Tax=Methylocella tundrae TaxID=227605 RepID=A0A4U8YUF5_METTU|nr:protein of unknown function [Methylocella tundrae]